MKKTPVIINDHYKLRLIPGIDFTDFHYLKFEGYYGGKLVKGIICPPHKGSKAFDNNCTLLFTNYDLGWSLNSHIKTTLSETISRYYLDQAISGLYYRMSLEFPVESPYILLPVNHILASKLLDKYKAFCVYESRLSVIIKTIKSYQQWLRKALQNTRFGSRNSKKRKA